MTVFGNSALDAIMNDGFIMPKAVSTDVSTALFKFLEHFAFSGLTSIVAIILVSNFFFVTSSDSGSLVVDTIASGEKIIILFGKRIFYYY